MLNSNGRNLSVLLGMAFSTCRKSDGAPILGRRGPLYVFNVLLTEKLPRLDARDAKLLVLVTHSLPLVAGRSSGSEIGGGIKRG